MIGRTISHYRIVRELGAGGMGVVYAAEDVRLGRQVAIKFVPDGMVDDRQMFERLRSEARTASALNHPNICTLYDVGDHDGRPFIVMELLQGRTLRDRLIDGQLKVDETLEIGIQVADALDVAHRQHIIHRDIKPANLFLNERGPVKILDFGLAKVVSHQPSALTAAPTDLTGAGMTLGTVSYMSPEQVTADPLDGRSDIFSFGVVLYECATGHQPFKGKTSGLILSEILNRTPPPPLQFNPDLPLRLQEIITNCLEKDRELRYQDAGALRTDLKRLKRDLESGPRAASRLSIPIEGASSVAQPITVTLPSAAVPPSRRSRGLLAAAIAAVVVASTAAAFFAFRASTAQPKEAAVRAVEAVQPRRRRCRLHLLRLWRQAGAGAIAAARSTPRPAAAAPRTVNGVDAARRGGDLTSTNIDGRRRSTAFRERRGCATASSRCKVRARTSAGRRCAPHVNPRTGGRRWAVIRRVVAASRVRLKGKISTRSNGEAESVSRGTAAPRDSFRASRRRKSTSTCSRSSAADQCRP
jgi:hypothetical protein